MTEKMKCGGGGKETSVGYYCDETPETDELCETCFDKTDCGRGLHGESCATVVALSDTGE